MPGQYWGRIDPSPDFPLAGAVSVDLRVDGSFTGSLMAGAKKYPLTGRMTEANSYCSTPAKLAHTFTSGPQLASIQGSGPEDYLSLVIQPVGAGGSPTGISDLTLIKATTAPALTAEFLGKHNFALISLGGSFEIPVGHGFGTLSVTAARRGNYTATLADGSSITGSGWMSEGGRTQGEPVPRLYFYSPDAAGKQAIHGGVEITSPNTQGQEQVTWSRLPRPGRTYPEGFDWGPLEWQGSRYQSATASTVFASSGGTPSLGITPDYNSGTFPTSFQLSPQLKATVLA